MWFGGWFQNEQPNEKRERIAVIVVIGKAKPATFTAKDARGAKDAKKHCRR